MIPAVAVSTWHVSQVCLVLQSPQCFQPAGRPGMWLPICLWQRAFRFTGSGPAGGRGKVSPSMKNVAGRQYRFVLPGPRWTFAERAQCVDELRTVASSARFVVVSGSLPPDVPADFYGQIADVCGDLGTRLILDTSGSGLQHITSGGVPPQTQRARAT